MTDDKLHRHEIAPGCYIVSSEGTSRSGNTMADTVRAICEGADRRSARPTEPMCECGHPVEMRRGADRCGAHGCGCDRNAEEASWR